MNTVNVFAVVGSGKQGTAEAYDLARFGNASKIIMIDREYNLAEAAAKRINELSGTSVAQGIAADASDESVIASLLKKYKVNVCCGAAHYKLNLPLTIASIRAGSHFCDMGGNTNVVHHQHRLHPLAQQNGVAIIPDCGIAPGTANILANRALKKMNCDSVKIVCGGLPQARYLPLGYRIVFSIQGLTNEYTGKCTEIRNRRIVEVDAFTEKEELTLPEPLGKCEAFLTSGGTSTAPWSFLGKLKNYGYKTVRYTGHYDAVNAMIEMGFLRLDTVNVNDVPVVPRELFHILASRYWDYPAEPDLLVMQVNATGHDSSGKPSEMTQYLLDYQDQETGFTAMERTTAFSASIIAILLAENTFEGGVHPLEITVDPEYMVKELKKRGIKIETSLKSLSK